MKLLETVRPTLRLRHFALRTEECSLRWIEQYLRCRQTAEGFRHPATRGAAEVEAFLGSRAAQRHVSSRTPNQARAALLFLDRDVLPQDLGSLDAVRARRSRRLPGVLSRAERARVLDASDRLATDEPSGLRARLLYGL